MSNQRYEAEQDELGTLGDPRRCPWHGEVTSSPDGMFDAPCGACEHAYEEECAARAYEAECASGVAPAPAAAVEEDDGLVF